MIFIKFNEINFQLSQNQQYFTKLIVYISKSNLFFNNNFTILIQFLTFKFILLLLFLFLF